MAPKGTPDEIRNKIASDLSKVLSDPALRKQLGEGGFVVRTTTPAQLEVKMQKDLLFWREQVEKSGARAE
jgi:tripartite-type tricarboxylate transporter receptor subunit TctC